MGQIRGFLTWDNIVTPINVPRLQALLHTSKYDVEKARKLVQGFQQGFDIGYQGPLIRKNTARNLPLNIGTKLDLWNKVIKEVRLGRYTGPFPTIPFTNFVQSPIGLVPKSGNKMRLIFHLSYDFSKTDDSQKSINFHTPVELSSVKYKDLDYAVTNCLRMVRGLIDENGQFLDDSKSIFYSKTDLMSAFRILPVLPTQRPFLLMCAHHPVTNKLWYFVEKNLPFDASGSCYLFQEFSDALRHITEFVLDTKFVTTNYLDDFLFCGIDEQVCNHRLTTFLAICE